MMTRFLWKGIVRDRSRSLLPLIVVSIGVFVAVVLDGFVGGMLHNMLNTTATHTTGHVRVTSRAYLENEEQKPIDMALLDAEKTVSQLKERYPQVDWKERIAFGGLLDIPDANGETKAQGPVVANAYDLLTARSTEVKRLKLEDAVVEGAVPAREGQILVSIDFANKFGVKPGDELTFFGNTMYGSMSFANYSVSGVIRYGIGMLDRGAIVMDLRDARQLLDMEDAASEILGFLPEDEYDSQQCEQLKTDFNAIYADDTDEYAPVMVQLADQELMKAVLPMMNTMTTIYITLLILALGIVLWNTGLLGGIRRYGEFGIRLAIGEEKGHIYRSLLTESLLLGIVGSVIGTALGIGVCYYLYRYGIDYSSVLDKVAWTMDPVIRAIITPRSFYIGFIPGIAAILFGTALAGRAIYKRQTANLFKELD